MIIKEIITALAFANKKYLLKCELEQISVESRIYIVGQVQRSTPGVTLGDREPYLREKDVGTFLEELGTLGEEFQDKDFLIQYEYEVSQDSYELRYFELTHIEVVAGEIVLKSSIEDIHELRELHSDSDIE